MKMSVLWKGAWYKRGGSHYRKIGWGVGKKVLLTSPTSWRNSRTGEVRTGTPSGARTLREFKNFNVYGSDRARVAKVSKQGLQPNKRGSLVLSVR